MTFAEEFDNYCKTFGRPDYIEILLGDINGRLLGKWLPWQGRDKLVKGDVRIPISTLAYAITGEEVEATGLGLITGDPDGCLTPISGRLQPVIWAKDNRAQLLVDMVDFAGAPVKLSPRYVLQQMCNRCDDRGIVPVMATELEFTLIKPRIDGHDAPCPPDGVLAAQPYDLDVVATYAPILQDILATAKAQDLPVDTLSAEYAPGQFEINFRHSSDILACAEVTILFKRLVRNVVKNHNMAATFMAKPYVNHAGNGMHVHLSLQNLQGQNLFAADKRGRLTPELMQAVAGLMDSLPAMQAIFMPTINAYRRLQAGSFAPTHVNWGDDDRSVAVRIAETTGQSARLEHRLAGADANPYLVLSAILGGVLLGFDQASQAEDCLAKYKQDSAPLHLHFMDALGKFADSDHVAAIFGANFRDVYVALRRFEHDKLTAPITPQEYAHYLERI